MDLPYREALGSLMNLMAGSRPDIAYAVSKHAHFCENSQRKHWRAVKRVLKYKIGTKKSGLSYKRSTELLVYGYSDLN